MFNHFYTTLQSKISLQMRRKMSPLAPCALLLVLGFPGAATSSAAAQDQTPPAQTPSQAPAQTSTPAQQPSQTPDNGKPKQDVPAEAGGPGDNVGPYAIPKKTNTDAPPPPDIADALTEAGVEFILADG